MVNEHGADPHHRSSLDQIADSQSWVGFSSTRFLLRLDSVKPLLGVMGSRNKNLNSLP